MKKSILSALFLGFVLTNSSAFAGGNVENGGDGVMIGQELYSLDLVEYGLERAPYLSDPIAPSASLQSLAGPLLSKLSPRVRKIVLAKLARAQGLSTVLREYSLVFVRAPLSRIHDVKTAIDENTLYQIASHDDRTIRVNLAGYERMNPANQSAVIVHEILYASFKADKDSRRARRVNAYLFDPTFADPSAKNLYELAKRYGTGSLEEESVSAPGAKLVWKDFLSLTALLLHFDGVDGSKMFTDVLGNFASSNGAIVSTAQYKIGGASAMLTGDRSFIELPSKNYQFGSDDFTVEFYFRVAKLPGTLQGLVSMYDNGGPYAWSIAVAENNSLRVTLNKETTLYGPPVESNVWYHLAAERRGDTISLYLNGTLAGMQAVNGALPVHPGQLVIGAIHSNSLERYNYAGNLDELRITKGLARYTAAFTPPSLPFAND